jgi:hypothetical protein
MSPSSRLWRHDASRCGVARALCFPTAMSCRRGRGDGGSGTDRAAAAGIARVECERRPHQPGFAGGKFLLPSYPQKLCELNWRTQRPRQSCSGEAPRKHGVSHPLEHRAGQRRNHAGKGVRRPFADHRRHGVSEEKAGLPRMQ